MTRLRWLVALFLVFGAVSAWGSAEPATAQKRPILILGVKGTLGIADDPSAPNNIAAYTHNFSKIIPLSYRSDGSSKSIDELAIAADWFSAARVVVTGELSDRTQDVLRSIGKNIGNRVVFAHSWGTVALVTAINSGLIPAPKSLVLINPPVLTAAGAAQWRAFAEKHPDMPIDIYVGIDDPSQLTRMALPDAAKRISQGPFYNFTGPDLTPGDAISGFLTPNHPARIRVRMYPGGHRLNTFFDFAARHHLNGITSSTPTASGADNSFPGLMPVFNGLFAPRDDIGASVQPQAQSGYAFLAATQDGLRQAQKVARLQDVQTYGLTREQLEARAETVREQLRQARWDAFEMITDTACNTPYMLDEADVQGLMPSFSIPISDVTAGVGVHQDELSACQLTLIKEMLARPSQITLAWLAQWGRSYRHEHSLTTHTKRFFKHVGGLISSGAASLLSALDALVPTLPDGTDSGYSSGESSPERNSHSSSDHSRNLEIQSSAYGQAQTIDLTESWGGN